MRGKRCGGRKLKAMDDDWREQFQRVADYDKDPLEELPGRLMQVVTGICSCGSGQDFELLLEVFRFCAMRPKPEGKSCYDSPGWELAAKVLDGADVIDHGTGIGWPWLSTEGEQVFAELKKLDEMIAAKAVGKMAESE